MDDQVSQKKESSDIVSGVIGLIIFLMIISYCADSARDFIAKINKPADTNLTLVYGDTGYPKNCRAIITDNIEGVNRGDYTPEEALGSINRNCGRNGYSWGQ